jgi:sugar lactone lactonase YvrE
MRLHTTVTTAGAALLLLLPSLRVEAANPSFIGPLHTITPIAFTVPSNGDVNPYGVAVVPTTVGALVAGNVLVSNFNNLNNSQGTGTTIVQITPSGKLTVFAQITPASVPACVGGVGLTTALVALKTGWVIVGSLPTSDGSAATAQAGCLIVLNSSGQPVETFQGNGINGPWDMTALDLGNSAYLFVTNVLNGTVAGNGNEVKQGSVLRIQLSVSATTMPTDLGRLVIGNGFGERSDTAALIIGPTGLAVGVDGALFVADTLANRIAVIPQAATRTTSAGTGITLAQGDFLYAPLGLAVAPNGDLLAVNAGNGNMVEVTLTGEQVAKNVDVTGIGVGTLFGLAVNPSGTGVYFVNDGNNSLYLLQ